MSTRRFNKPKVGDLIMCDWDYGNQVYERYEFNRSKNPIFRIGYGKLCLVLEVGDINTLPGVKVLTDDGKIGWTNWKMYVLVT